MPAKVPPGHIRVEATVIIELVAPDLDSVSDLVHESFADMDDALDACIVVTDSKEVAQFSWESAQ